MIRGAEMAVLGAISGSACPCGSLLVSSARGSDLVPPSARDPRAHRAWSAPGRDPVMQELPLGSAMAREAVQTAACARRQIARCSAGFAELGERLRRCPPR